MSLTTKELYYPYSNNVFIEDIDDILGDSKNRYFGKKYKDVEYELGTPEVRDDGEVILNANIIYPKSWSLKIDKDKNIRNLTPHLSTIDVVYLSVALSEWYLSSMYALDDKRNDHVLSKIKITSGNSPDEVLSGIPVVIKDIFCEGYQIKRCPYKILTNYTMTVGRMNVEISYAHSSIPRSTVAINKTQIINDDTLYSRSSDESLMRQHKVSLKKINIDKREGSIWAVVEFEQINEQWRLISPVDVILIVAQLVQAIVYTVDGVKREESNNLWMRDIHIESFVPFRAGANEMIEAKVITHKTHHSGDEIWSTFRIFLFVGAFHISTTVSHKISGKKHLA